jgi:signal transduction histidine kinase
LFLIFLDNAIKYSPPQSRVRVRLGAPQGIAKVEFQDEGMGISDEHLPHIFERFYRGAPQTSEGVQSGGLGLAIAQAIVRAEGGSIHCQTALGRGTTFTIRLPLRTRQPATQAK